MSEPIFTDERGRPIPKPQRSDFGRGIDADIDYMRAVHDWHDRIASLSSSAFADQFQRSMRKKRRSRKMRRR